MSSVFGEAAIILAFILAGGVFAAAEIALVSLREGQVRQLATRGRRGQAVKRLTADPNRFLSVVQVGVTVCTFLGSAFGGATIAVRVAPLFAALGLPPGVASTVALVLVTLVVAYVSIVLGELTAKRIALQRAEGVALVLAPFLDWMARLSRPVIWFLSVSTNVAVRLLGGDPKANREQMSDEELRELVSGHETLGEDERRILDEVFAAGQRQVREVMLPRTEVDFLDAATPVYKAAKLAVERPHSRYPVTRGSADDVVGFVHVRDLLDPAVSGRSVRVGDLVREIVMIPATKRVLSALNELRARGQHVAIVVDEYGGTAGLVTLEDLIEELIGDIRDEYDVEVEDTARKLVSGELEVDGRMSVEDFSEETGIVVSDGPYETVAGFVIARLGHVPATGETVDIGTHRFTVTEMEGRRVAKVRVTTTRPAEPAPVEDVTGVA